MVFWRIRCHFCGSRQPHSKSVTSFQCSDCEAVNFFDGKGNVVDTPASALAPTPSSKTTLQSFTRPLPDALDHQHIKAFCRTCTQNQLLYNETLANYLPEEDHPQYKQFEAAIPVYKAELEKRYPLVCKRCAPMAQTKINRADYYGMTQNARRLLSATRARNGQPALRMRDSWGKKSTRIFLRLVALVLYLGILAQVLYHTYGILNILFGAVTAEPELTNITEPLVGPLPSECARESLNFHFSSPCYKLFSNLIPRTLALATCFLWFNPGIKLWFHHTIRMEAVHGQKNYLYMQVIMLAIRSWAWFHLSQPDTTSSLDREQLIGLHIFVIVFLLLTQVVADQSIQPVIWTMRGKIMPKPSELDVLSESAGPSPEHYTPKASERDPFKYLKKPDNGPFDINLLAPQPPKQPSFSRTSYLAQQPSPDCSDEEADYDAMETDYRPVMRSSQSFSRSNLQPRNVPPDDAPGIRFGSMTDEVFSMQTKLRHADESRRIEQAQKLSFQPPQKERSPFYGTLPPAPMSMERRLRNPIIKQAEPQMIPLSQQKDFMTRMRAGVKPVQFPEKGTNFELKKSEWILPTDSKETGLEDRFLTTFNLADPTPPGQNASRGFFGLFGR